MKLKRKEIPNGFVIQTEEGGDIVAVMDNGKFYVGGRKGPWVELERPGELAAVISAITDDQLWNVELPDMRPSSSI
jgi:hypothetical protein